MIILSTIIIIKIRKEKIPVALRDWDQIGNNQLPISNLPALWLATLSSRSTIVNIAATKEIFR